MGRQTDKTKNRRDIEMKTKTVKLCVMRGVQFKPQEVRIIKLQERRSMAVICLSVSREMWNLRTPYRAESGDILHKKFLKNCHSKRL